MGVIAMEQTLMKTPQGSILLVVLVIGSLFALVLFLAVNLVLFDQMGAEATVRAIEAFYIAEAGLACGLAYVLHYDHGTMNDLLAGEDGQTGGVYAEDDGVLPLGPRMCYGNGSVRVRVLDNPEPDKDPYADSDSVFILSSTASIEPSAQKTLWALLRCEEVCSVVSWMEPLE